MPPKSRLYKIPHEVTRNDDHQPADPLQCAVCVAQLPCATHRTYMLPLDHPYVVKPLDHPYVVKYDLVDRRPAGGLNERLVGAALLCCRSHVQHGMRGSIGR